MYFDQIFEELGPIEKKIHVTWKNKDILDLDFNIIKNGIYKLKHLNPDYSFEISDDKDVDLYLEKKLSPYDFQLVKDKHIVEKCDLWRLLKVYHEGGVYSDIDRLWNIPLERIIDKEDIKCIIPTYFDLDFSQSIMISSAGNLIHKRAIELNLERRKGGETNILYLGPVTYLHAVTEVLLKKQISRETNVNFFNLLRKMIEQSKFLKTFRESPPFNTISYQGPVCAFDKKAFYQHQNVAHWVTFSVKAVGFLRRLFNVQKR